MPESTQGSSSIPLLILFLPGEHTQVLPQVSTGSKYLFLNTWLKETNRWEGLICNITSVYHQPPVWWVLQTVSTLCAACLPACQQGCRHSRCLKIWVWIAEGIIWCNINFMCYANNVCFFWQELFYWEVSKLWEERKCSCEQFSEFITFSSVS